MVARFRGCLASTWSSREVREGRPIVYVGVEHATGWYSGFGGFVLGEDGRVSVFVNGGGDDVFYAPVSLTDKPTGAWADPLRTVVASASSGFEPVRGVEHREGGPFNSWSWYEATGVIPGAWGCRVQAGGMVATFYECTLAKDVEPATMHGLFGKAVDDVGRALGPEWVVWKDVEVAAHGLSFVHFARRTSRGYERVPVVTVGLSEREITMSVVVQGVQ